MDKNLFDICLESIIEDNYCTEGFKDTLKKAGGRIVEAAGNAGNKIINIINTIINIIRKCINNINNIFRNIRGKDIKSFEKKDTIKGRFKTKAFQKKEAEKAARKKKMDDLIAEMHKDFDEMHKKMELEKQESEKRIAKMKEEMKKKNDEAGEERKKKAEEKKAALAAEEKKHAEIMDKMRKEREEFIAEIKARREEDAREEAEKKKYEIEFNAKMKEINKRIDIENEKKLEIIKKYDLKDLEPIMAICRGLCNDMRQTLKDINRYKSDNDIIKNTIEDIKDLIDELKNYNTKVSLPELQPNLLIGYVEQIRQKNNFLEKLLNKLLSYFNEFNNFNNLDTTINNDELTQICTIYLGKVQQIITEVTSIIEKESVKIAKAAALID